MIKGLTWRLMSQEHFTHKLHSCNCYYKFTWNFISRLSAKIKKADQQVLIKWKLRIVAQIDKLIKGDKNTALQINEYESINWNVGQSPEKIFWIAK